MFHSITHLRFVSPLTSYGDARIAHRKLNDVIRRLPEACHESIEEVMQLDGEVTRGFDRAFYLARTRHTPKTDEEVLQIANNVYANMLLAPKWRTKHDRFVELCTQLASSV